jgi:acyl-CoA synthetase (NDP forming)
MTGRSGTDASRTAIEALIRPRSIAVIGASPDINRLNGRPLHYLQRDGFRGRLYPVNPNYRDIRGLRCYPDIDSLPEAPDVAIIAVAAARVIDAIIALGHKGTPAAIVFSSGFGEAGEDGRHLEDRLRRIAQEHGVRICGPNNLGVINAFDGATATFSQYAATPPLAGPVAFASQSGAFGTAIAALARARGIGFGYFVNTGNEVDLGVAEILAPLLDDDRIRVAAAYLEGLKDGPALLRLAEKAAAVGKPLIVVKVGRQAAGARAAASHTGSLAGEDRVFDGVAHQHGIIRARNEEHMLDLIAGIVACSPPRGGGVALITQSGGAAALMADRAEDLGLTVPVLSRTTQANLRAVMPAFGVPSNPVDVTGQFLADPAILRDSVRLSLDDPAVDSAIVWLQLMHGYADTLVEIFLSLKKTCSKPFVVCWVAAPEAALRTLRDAGICVLGATERTVDVVAGLVRWGVVSSRRRSRPAIGAGRKAASTDDPKHPSGSERPVPSLEARGILAAAGVPVIAARLARTPAEAARVTAHLGFPVAIKIESPDILHKTEADGVRLGLRSASAARRAARDVLSSARRHAPRARIDGVLVQPMASPGQELMIGIRRDPAFGPVVMFGLGGIFVETLRDVAFARAPLTPDDARGMIERLAGRAILEGVRGRAPVDRRKLTRCLVAVSKLAASRPDIVELDLNPIFASERGIVAVDWLMISDADG